MMRLFLKPLHIIFLFILSSLSLTSFSDSYTKEFTPPYYDCVKWSTATTPLVSGANSGANFNSGAVAIYCSGWIGGGASSATQYVLFYVPAKSSIKAKIKIMYVGGTVNYGFASFSGTEWQWNINNGSFHKYDIESPFSWDVIAGKVIDIALLILGAGFVPEGTTLAQVVELFDLINTINQLGQSLQDLIESDDAKEVNGNFSFTVTEGYHVLGVGIRGNAAGCLTGSGFAVMGGQVSKITLDITNDYNGSPDLNIADIELSQGKLQRGQSVYFKVSLGNIGKAVADNDKFSFDVLVPGTSTWTNVLNNSGNYISFEPHTTECRNVFYTFNKKGDYELRATADPTNMVSESDETNNCTTRKVYVTGLAPNKPSIPSGIPNSNILYRNNTYTLSTSTSDPDSDSLKYVFKIRPTSDTWYFTPGWSQNEGWNDTGKVVFTPTYENGMAVAGNYYISAQAIDSDGLLSPWSDEKFYCMWQNSAPQTPILSAPYGGYTIDTLSFSAYSSDMEGDKIGYHFNWGDKSATTQYYYPKQGESSVTATHKFDNPGTYTVQVQAMDEYGLLSSWANAAVKIFVYVPPPGTIDVAANHPLATFTLTGSGNAQGTQFNGSGTFWWQYATPGTYTITFGSINGYNTPSSSAKTLSSNGNIKFDGNYTHQTGSIQVSTNHSSASFTIKGSGTASGQNHTGSGTSWSKSGAYVGDYTISFNTISGYCLPPTNNQTKTLTKDSIITFNASYLLPPVAVLDFYTTNSFVIKREEAIDFDGSDSYHREASLDIVKYRFTFGDGKIYIETADNAPDGKFDGKTKYVYYTNGNYNPTLTVYDCYGNSAKDSGAVLVKSRPVARMTIEPFPPIAGEDVNFTGKGFDDDYDAIVAYVWNSSIDGALSNQASFNTDELSTGTHTISLKVQDSDLLWSEENEMFLPVFEPKDWQMFKQNEKRLSTQTSYWSRIYGQLNYAPLWLFPTAGPITGSPVAGDLNDDWTDGLEIAFASIDGKLYLLTSMGTILKSCIIGASSSTPAIDHLTPGGPPCVVVGSSNGVYAYDVNGNQQWLFSSVPAGAGSFDSSPVIADINSNPQDGKETVIGCNDGHVYAINSSGILYWAFPPVPPPPPPPPIASFTGSPAVADIEPQLHGLETVIGRTDGYLYVISSTGTLVTSWPPAGAPVGQIWTTPAIAHLVPNPLANGGVETNFVFGSDDGHTYCLWYSTGTLTLSWQYPKAGDPALAPIRSSPAVSVVGESSSGKGQVVFGCDNGTVYVLQGFSGQSRGSFNCGVGTMVRSTPAIANIDTINNINPEMGDQPEVVFGATNGKFYGVSFAMGNGINLPWSPLNLSGGVGQPILSSPAVADINHDPELEILIGANNNSLYMIAPMKNPALKPVVDFSANPTSGNPSLSVSFTDQSTNNPLLWAWDFGDDVTTTTQQPTHTYTSPGKYSVTLSATNSHGYGTLTKVDYITVNPVPIAAFSHSPLSGDAQLIVNFSDQSSNNPTSWNWTFGDGGTKSEKNPTYTYNQPGVYTVILTASNTYGSDTITKTNCVLVLAPPTVADFTQDVTSGTVSLIVHFTDLSTGDPTSWLWNFGDGSTSTQKNPAYTYKYPGSYLVSLTVSNSRDSDTKTNSVLIAVNPQTDSVMIPNVPDINQPPTETLSSTNQNDFSAPMATVNISEYWDYVIKDSNALGVNASLTSPTIAEYVGYFSDTNNTGSVDRGNGTDNHKGTFTKDIDAGLFEFARWDSLHPYNTPPAIPPSLPPLKKGYKWRVNTDYTADWNFYKTEINSLRPSIIVFLYWNPQPTGITLTNMNTAEVIDIFKWGAEISNSTQVGQENPEEEWNLQTGGQCIGHSVTGVGYIENWDPDNSGPLPASNYAIVYDTWSTTPKNVAIPWTNQVAIISVGVVRDPSMEKVIWHLY